MSRGVSRSARSLRRGRRPLSHSYQRCGEFVVEVEDSARKVSRDRYVGVAGARPKALDSLGRVRRVRSDGS